MTKIMVCGAPHFSTDTHTHTHAHTHAHMFPFRYYGRATSVLDGLFTLMLEGATRQLVARDKVLRLVEAVKWDTPYVSD